MRGWVTTPAGSLAGTSCGSALLLAERQQCNVPGALDRPSQHALVLGARSGLPARLDLAAIRHIPAQASEVLVVDGSDAIHAKGADFAAWEVATPPTEPAARRAFGAFRAVTLFPRRAWPP
jgi:hypothetical protein